MRTTHISAAANAQQLDAITAADEPLLILADPGSGKPFTLVEHIVALRGRPSKATQRRPAQSRDVVCALKI